MRIIWVVRGRYSYAQFSGAIIQVDCGLGQNHVAGRGEAWLGEARRGGARRRGHGWFPADPSILVSFDSGINSDD